VGSGRRDPRKDRVQEFSARFASRHPRLAGAIICILFAGFTLGGAGQLSYGSYLGLGWMIAAYAGMATAAGLIVAVVIGHRRDSPATVGLLMAWMVAWLLSVVAFRLPFPHGHYGRVQAFFDVLHAALLGYETVACTAVVILFAYMALHPRVIARTRTVQAGHAPDRGEIPARLRFPAAMSGTWRAGRLIAANGTVKWQSLKGDAEVDLTSASQAQPVPPADTRKRQPRTTTLATGEGIVEVDVSPVAFERLASWS
jgi:hypothetical protein